MAPSDSDSASVGSEDRPASFHTTRSSSDSPDAVDPTTRTVASQPDLAPLSPTSPAAAGSLSAPDLSTPPSSAGPLPTASRQDSTAGSSRMTPGLQVRAGLISRIYRGLGEMRGNRRLGLMLMGIVTLAQLVAFVTVLALSSGQQCDEPLQAYIIVHTVRVTLSWPASFYIALAPRRPSRNDANPEETRRNREAQRVFGTESWDRRVKMFQDVMTLLAFTWFILGNYLFFSTRTCKQTSPELYWTSLAVVIFGWLYALEIIFLVLAVTFFLPIVIIGIRLFGWGSKKQEIGPCDQDQIDRIPLVLYIPAPDDDPSVAQPQDDPTTAATGDQPAIEMSQMPAAEASTTTPAAVQEEEEKPAAEVPTTSQQQQRRGRRRRKLARLFFPSRRRHPRPSSPTGAHFTSPSSSYIPTPYPLHPLPANQSTCPICLCDFEPPPLRSSGQDPTRYEGWEPLRRLERCRHCFHKDCLDEWLKTSGRCPLCQEPVEGDRKGKKRGQARRDVED